jgi:hypothetical protein
MTDNITYIPGYRLHHAARRASIQIGTLRAPVYATTAEFPQRYARTRTDGLPLEKTPPIEPMWHSVLAGLLTLFAIAIMVIIT